MNVYIGKPVEYSDMQGPAPSGFHVPMKSEWEGVGVIMGLLNLDTSSGWKQNLKMPYTGYRSSSNGLVGTSTQGVLGEYRSCSFYDDPNYNFYASILYLTSWGTVNKNYATSKSSGITIRPFHDGYVAPDNSWTVIQGTLGSAGIFRDETNGLISITGDGTTGYTIADKNLGATTVYSDGDTLAETNCGKYYQWGNNYGFAWTGSVTTSSTLVNASAYGPNNNYSSSTFITTSASPYDWSSVQNDNLRGGVTGVGGESELKNAYIGEYNWMGVLPSTVCSYPFIDNNTDLTGKTALSSGGTKQTIGYKFSGTSDISYGSGGTATSIFASYRIKSNRAYGTDGNCLVGGTEKGRMGYNVSHSGGYQNAVQFSNGTWYKSNTLGTVNTRMHLAYGFNGTEAYVYKNGVKQVIATSTTYAEAVNKYFIDWNGSQYDVTVAYFLLDGIDRENEIIPFFNKTKSQFGL